VTITRLKLERFTAFENLDLKPDKGLNVFIGANGTGKTHLMKVLYAACDISKTQQEFADKLVRVFLPSRRALGRLVKRKGKSSVASIEVETANARLGLSFSNHADERRPRLVKTTGAKEWEKQRLSSVFIPVKEMLANGPGFRSLYAQRDVHFEEIYADILDRAFLPILRGPMDQGRADLLTTLQEKMDGKVSQKNEEFFLKNKQGELEFTLLAEGTRKLGLLWLLIQNGTLLSGSVLFWDEPETNLNPKLFSVVVDILLQLQRLGVQVFVATHDYALLKEFELAAQPSDSLAFFTLYRPTASAEVLVERAAAPFLLQHSPIAEAMTSLYDREIRRSLGGK
jgi:predicted ATPase